MPISLPSTTVRPPIEPGHFRRGSRANTAIERVTPASRPKARQRSASSSASAWGSQSVPWIENEPSSMVIASRAGGGGGTPLRPRPTSRRRQGSSSSSGHEHHLSSAYLADKDKAELDFGFHKAPGSSTLRLRLNQVASQQNALSSSSSGLLRSPQPLLHRSQSEATLRHPAVDPSMKSASALRRTPPSSTVMPRHQHLTNGRSSTPTSSSSHNVNSSVDLDALETASEGHSSTWLGKLGHSKEASDSTNSSAMWTPIERAMSLGDHSDAEVEELKEPEPHAYDESSRSDFARSTAPSLTFSSYETSSQALEDGDGEFIQRASEAKWGAKFWVVIEDPKSTHLFFYNPTTTECRWTVPAGTFVLPRDPGGDWLEFWDGSVGLPYYWHTASKKTQWEYPASARLVLPLAKIQQGIGEAADEGDVASSLRHLSASSNGAHHEKKVNVSNRPATTSRSSERPSMPFSTSTSSSTTAITRARSMNDVKAQNPTEHSSSHRQAPSSSATSHNTNNTPPHDCNGSGNGNDSSGGMTSADSGVALADESSRSLSRRRLLEKAKMENGMDSAPRVSHRTSLRDISEQTSRSSGTARRTSSSAGKPATTLQHPTNTRAAASRLLVPPVSSLLSVPQPPSQSQRSTARKHNHKPGQSSIDLATLSSASVRGPVRRHRDPERRARDSLLLTSGESMQPILTKTRSPHTMPADVAPVASKGDSRNLTQPWDQATSPLVHFHSYAHTHFLPRRRALPSFFHLSHRQSSILDALKYQRGRIEAPVLNLPKELHGEAGLCSKIVLRACGERERAAFVGRPPPVAIGYAPTGMGLTGTISAQSPLRRCAERKKGIAQQRSREMLGRDHGTVTSIGNGDGSVLPPSHDSTWKEQRWLLETLICKPALRDEVFCQLLPRLSDQAPFQTRARAWQFLGVLLASVAPTTRKLEEALQLFIADSCSALSNNSGATTASTDRLLSLHRHAQRRLIAVQMRGPSSLAPTLPELRASWSSAFHPIVFGQTLNTIMAAQSRSYAHMAIPVLLPFLGDKLMELGARGVKGMWRQQGDVGMVVEGKIRIDRGEYSLQGLGGKDGEKKGKLALVVAALLKLFLKELAEPLIPYGMYEACIQAAEHGSGSSRPTSTNSSAAAHSNHSSAAATAAALALVSPRNEGKMPALNRRCLLYVVALLQLFCLDERVVQATGADAKTLAGLFSPVLMRPPPWSTMAGASSLALPQAGTTTGSGTAGLSQPALDRSMLRAGNSNAKWESVFVYHLLTAWDTQNADVDFMPRIGNRTRRGPRTSR